MPSADYECVYVMFAIGKLKFIQIFFLGGGGCFFHSVMIVLFFLLLLLGKMLFWKRHYCLILRGAGFCMTNGSVPFIIQC